MSRYWTSIRAALLSALVLTIASVATAYTNPIDVIDVAVCTGETPAQDGVTPHNDPAVWDKCRTSSSWSNSHNASPGDVVQADVLFTINDVGLKGYSISITYDTELDNVLDHRALSVYNVSPSGCVPQGNPEISDGGCEELNNNIIRPNKWVTIVGEQPNVTRDITVYDPNSNKPQPRESDDQVSGLYPSQAGITVGLPPAATKKAFPPTIRVASYWFDTNAVEGGTNTEVRAILTNNGVDGILDSAFSDLKPTDAWDCTSNLATCAAANVPYWKSSNITVPEPAIAMIQFGAICAIGFVASRRRR